MWSTRLAPKSISTFDELAKKFIKQFQLHTARPKNVMSLSDLSQGPTKSLKGFLNRFNVAIAEVSNPKADIVFMALAQGIHSNTDFERWIKMIQPTIMEEFHRKANQFLRLEEASIIEGKHGGERTKKGNQ